MRNAVMGAALAMVLSLVSIAHANNVCLSFNSTHVVASGLVLPGKGTCASFNGFYLGKPGFLLAGDICKSSDGTTYLFNTFTQFNGLPDSLIGKWSTSTGTGSGNECTSAAICTAFSVTVIKCPANPSLPNVLSTDLSDPESQTPPSFMTTGEP